MERENKSFMQRMMERRPSLHYRKRAANAADQQDHHQRQQPQKAHHQPDNKGENDGDAAAELVAKTMAEIDDLIASFHSTTQEFHLVARARQTRYADYPKRRLIEIVSLRLAEWLREGGQDEFVERFHEDYQIRQSWYKQTCAHA